MDLYGLIWTYVDLYGLLCNQEPHVKNNQVLYGLIWTYMD